MDWTDQARADTLTFSMIGATNLDANQGELKDVILDKCKVSAGYYTDTRTSGEIWTSGINWKRGSRIRITHTAPGWSNHLGTYIVVDDDCERVHGEWRQRLVLQSSLFAISKDVFTGPFTVAKNAYALAAIKKIISGTRQRPVYNRPKDRRYGSAKVYETGTSRLSALLDICSYCGNRLDVDGYGRITVGPYVKPAYKTPKLTIDIGSPNGTVHDGVKLSTDWLSMPNAATVSYKYTNSKGTQKEVRATAWVSSRDHTAQGIRGYSVMRFEQLNECHPANYATALKKAQSILSANSLEHIEWEVTTQYLPIWEGDVVNLLVPDGQSAYKGTRKCLVKNVDIDLGTMQMALVLKETKSGDSEDD